MTWLVILAPAGVIFLIALVVGIQVTFFPTQGDCEAYLDRWAD